MLFGVGDTLPGEEMVEAAWQPEGEHKKRAGYPALLPAHVGYCC